MISIAMCISEQAAGLGTTLSFIFCKSVENDPLGNFLEQEFVDRVQSANISQTIQKMKTMTSGPITSWQIDGETAETVSDFIFLGLQNHCRW